MTDVPKWKRAVEERKAVLPTKPESKPVAPTFKKRPHTDRERAYLVGALQGLCDWVLSSVEGHRNIALNEAAFRAGQLVAGCGLHEEWARQNLARVGKAVGLGPGEILSTINSGVTMGKKKPIVMGPFVPEEQQKERQRRDAKLVDAYLRAYDVICDATNAGIDV